MPQAVQFSIFVLPSGGIPNRKPLRDLYVFPVDPNQMAPIFPMLAIWHRWRGQIRNRPGIAASRPI